MLKIAPALLLLTAALAANARADLITWSAPQDIVAATDVRLNGTLVTARNCWAQTLASPTVNGVTFPAYAPSGWNNGGWTLLAGSTTGDAGLDALLDSARATSEPTGNPTGWGGIRIDNLGALTVGRDYLIQVWFSDQRPGVPTNVLNDRVMTLSSATGVATLASGVVTNLGSLTQGPLSLGLEADPNNTAGAGDTIFGQHAVGTFTRTSTDQLWLLVQGSHPLPSNVLLSHVNAFQIREVQLAPGTGYCFGDGTATLCPCSPAPVPHGAPGKGCPTNVFPGGAQTAATGTASIAADTVVLTATDLINGSMIFYQGATQQSGGLGVAFGDGLRCIQPTGIRRFKVKTVVGNTASYPEIGDNPINVAGLITLPGTFQYQGWYRSANPSFCTVATFNLTNGYSIPWGA